MAASVHPFPARMAADIALRRLRRLAPDSLVLDPMAGSGTVLRTASDLGHRGVGFDLDPLAVLMARVWTRPLDPDRLVERARDVLAQAGGVGEVGLPWIDEDPETSEYVRYWFAAKQQGPLRSIAHVLHGMSGPTADALRIALSRTIVTKLPGAGASLARDVSHSRPRKVLEVNDYSVRDGFLRSAERVGRLLRTDPPRGGVSVRRGDARRMTSVERGTVDAIVTSPPYLNAIDYLRGHRLALVWLGHRVADLRVTRSVSIGAERAPDPATADDELIGRLTAGLAGTDRLPSDVQGMLRRYALDVAAVMREACRVLRPGGSATFVVGDSTLRGVFVENTQIVKAAARMAGLRYLSQTRRELVPGRRYLPPPAGSTAAIDRRMTVEAVVTFVRPGPGHGRRA